MYLEHRFEPSTPPSFRIGKVFMKKIANNYFKKQKKQIATHTPEKRSWYHFTDRIRRFLYNLDL